MANDPFADEPRVNDPHEAGRVSAGRRLGAHLIDLVIELALYGSLMAIPVDWDYVMELTQAGDDEGIQAYVGQIAPLQQWYRRVAFVGMFLLLSIEFFTGGTIGKHLARIKLGTLDGQPGSFGLYWRRGMLRYSGFLVTLFGVLLNEVALQEVGLFLTVAAYISGSTALFNAPPIALHDRATKTTVWHKHYLRLQSTA